jgi:hypothetical protein
MHDRTATKPANLTLQESTDKVLESKSNKTFPIKDNPETLKNFSITVLPRNIISYQQTHHILVNLISYQRLQNAKNKRKTQTNTPSLKLENEGGFCFA